MRQRHRALVLAALGVGWLVTDSIRGVRAAQRRAKAIRVDLADRIHASGAGPAVQIAFIGDSLMTGDGLAATTQGLPSLVTRLVAARTGREVNGIVVARSGSRSDEITREMAPQLALIRPDIVVMSAGVNDALARRPRRRIERDLTALVSALRAAAPDAVVVAQPPFDLGDAPGLPWPLRRVVGWLTGRVGHLEVALFPRIGVAVSATGRPHARGFGADGFHPGPLGTPVMALRLVDELDLGPLTTDRGVASHLYDRTMGTV